MKDVEIRYIQKNQFSSMMCPSCKKNLRPHYHKDSNTPSYYFCQERLSSYANTPHYKYFNEDGYGYEVFLIWNDSKRGSLYSVKRSFENDEIKKIELTYSIPGAPNNVSKSITRTFSPNEFTFQSDDWDTLEEKVRRLVEISEIFQ